MNDAAELSDRAVRLLALADQARAWGDRWLAESLVKKALDCLDDAAATVAAEARMRRVIQRLRQRGVV